MPAYVADRCGATGLSRPGRPGLLRLKVVTGMRARHPVAGCMRTPGQEAGCPASRARDAAAHGGTWLVRGSGGWPRSRWPPCAWKGATPMRPLAGRSSFPMELPQRLRCADAPGTPSRPRHIRRHRQPGPGSAMEKPAQALRIRRIRSGPRRRSAMFPARGWSVPPRLGTDPRRKGPAPGPAGHGRESPMLRARMRHDMGTGARNARPPGG